ncbi:hypothetical protein D3C85_811050 [compost metagenome]
MDAGRVPTGRARHRIAENPVQFRRVGLGVFLAIDDRCTPGRGRAGCPSRSGATGQPDRAVPGQHPAFRAVDAAGVRSGRRLRALRQPAAGHVQRRSPVGGLAAQPVPRAAQRWPVQPVRPDRSGHRRDPLDLCRRRRLQRADRLSDCQPGDLHPRRQPATASARLCG